MRLEEETLRARIESEKTEQMLERFEDKSQDFVNKIDDFLTQEDSENSTDGHDRFEPSSTTVDELTPSNQESPGTATLSANVIFVLADDQDLHLESLAYQPPMKKHLVDEGLTFRHCFCSVALCCLLLVSRESLDGIAGAQYQCHGFNPRLW
ncbi:hypothetical protein MMC22_008225 [Lobaria immixta]|nr:hypothetical protein [Lobaria immixta]